MSGELSKILEYLESPNKQVRLRALKQLFRHPDATPLQLVQGLSSPDVADFGFLAISDLDNAMSEARRRLRGVSAGVVYEFLAERYAYDPDAHVNLVFAILDFMGTSEALALANRIQPTLPEGKQK